MAEFNQDHSSLEAISKIIFDNDLIRVGAFRCPPWYLHFTDTGPIQGYLIVFPRTGVCITHAGGAPIVADPNVVMFYNHHQLYRRHKLSERGDLCDWFAFKPQVIIEALHRFETAVVERPDKPFCFTHGPSDSHIYLLQRLVVKHLTDSTVPDPLFIEETMLYVLGKVIENAYRVRGHDSNQSVSETQREHATLTNEAQTILSTRFQERLSLTELAGELYSSPYHLCRVFRQQTSYTIHHYLSQVRLRTALEYVEQGETDLTRLALDLGFTHHSHFTQAFRQTFGLPPSSLKAPLSSRHLGEMSKILIARPT